jgi:hypothetical protein
MTTTSRVLLLLGLFAQLEFQILPAQAPRVRDSAGIRIVENDHGTWTTAQQFHVDPQPVLVFGGPAVASDRKLGRINGAARLRDGGIVLADGEKSRVSFFDSKGNLKFHLGPSSTLAAQFNGVWGMLHWGRDTVGIWDGVLNRLSAFNNNGRIVHWDRIDQPPDMKYAGWYSRAALILAGRFSSGERLGQVQGVTGMPAQGIEAESMSIDRISVKGKLTPIARVLRVERFRWWGPKYGAKDDLPFGRRGSVAVGATTWFYTDGSAFAIEERTPSGQLQAIIRVQRARTPVSPEAIKRFGAVRLSRIESARRPEYAQALAWLSYPKTEPAYTALLVDSQGQLWARTWAIDGEPATWDVFDERGRLLGPVVVPADLIIFEIGADYLLAKYTGRPEVEEVRVYRLFR